MRKYLISLLAVGAMWVIVLSCQHSTDKEVSEKEKAFVFQEKLSDYGFFTGKLADLNPAQDVFSYELNTPLFSDYAQKARFIKLPGGTSIHLASGEMNYPEGTVLIKNFFYHHNDAQPEARKRLIETRLLVKTGDRWKVANYEWNEAQTEAERNILGAKKRVSWVQENGKEREIEYVIPDNNDCKSCHKQDGEVMPIGPTVKNLNRDILSEGKSLNQLQYWASVGRIRGLDDIQNLAQLPQWDNPQSGNLDERSRAYLDVNCAHCHNAQGPASNTGLFLTYEEQEGKRIGIFKGPVSAAQGSGNLMYNIVPGHAEESILHFRMNSAETGIAMPELGKSIVHEEGVALIAAWINEMEERPGS